MLVSLRRAISQLLRKYVRGFTQTCIEILIMWLEKFLSKLPSVKAQEEEEEELIDPQQVLRDKCNDTEHCKSLAEKYQACNDRVNSRSKTTEICNEELFDWLHAVDHCVTKELWSKLK